MPYFYSFKKLQKRKSVLVFAKLANYIQKIHIKVNFIALSRFVMRISDVNKGSTPLILSGYQKLKRKMQCGTPTLP